MKRLLPLLVVTALVGCASAPDFSRQRVLHARYDGVSDDLLTAGLGKSGLGLATPPAVREPKHPSAAELRRRAIHANYRALADMSPNGGYGVLYGPNIDLAGKDTLGEGRIAVHAPDEQRHRHVLQRRELGQQVVKLVDKPERPVAEHPALDLRLAADVPAGHAHLARARRIESAENMEKRALAGAGRPDDRNPLARGDFEIDAEQHGDGLAPLIERLVNVAAGEDRTRSRYSGLLTHISTPRRG